MIDLSKFIPDPGSRATISHKEIKKWVESNMGIPEIFEDLSAGSDKTGIRIDFPGSKDNKLMNESVDEIEVSWSQFFKVFEDQKLAFIYEIEPKTKDKSMAYKFIKRENVDWETNG